MWIIALKTLVADRGKLLTALVGVVFSVVLVNVQGGLFYGMLRKASLLVDNADAEIWVGHRNMHNVDFPRDIPIRWIERVRSIPGVRNAEPYTIGLGIMTLPSGAFEEAVVVGVDRVSLLGNVWNMSQGDANDIRQTDGIIVDEYEDEKLEHPQIGELREINGYRARIVAKSKGIVGFLVAPYVFTTRERAARYTGKSLNHCSYYLVQLSEGARVDQVCQLIRDKVPDVDVFPKEVYSQTTMNYWITRTGLGISFSGAAILGLIIGLVMVAQSLYALVLDRLSEFATLKAVGARDHHVFSILLVQAVTMALAGFTLGIGLVKLMEQTASSPRAPLEVPTWLSIVSCLLVLVICLLSSLLPYLRVRKIDPQMVLQS